MPFRSRLTTSPLSMSQSRLTHCERPRVRPLPQPARPTHVSGPPPHLMPVGGLIEPACPLMTLAVWRISTTCNRHPLPAAPPAACTAVVLSLGCSKGE